jgi:hypothetical protein
MFTTLNSFEVVGLVIYMVGFLIQQAPPTNQIGGAVRIVGAACFVIGLILALAGK